MRNAHILRPLWAAVLGSALLSTASLAQQQVNLSNLPPNSVVGRLGGGQSGGAQSIPFATLLTQLNGLITVVSGPATTTSGDMVCWNNASGTLAKDCGIAVTGSGTLAFGSANTLTLSGSMTLTGGGTLNVASGKTLTDTSAIGASILLGATGGGFAAYGGASACGAGLYVTALSAAGASTCSTAKASNNTNVAGPTTTNNSTAAFVMSGLAGSITPTVTGNVLITISGTIIDPGATTSAGQGIQYQISYGTGSAPTGNAALTGTQVGSVGEWMIANTVTAADVFIPFSQTVVVTGLTVSTAYWIDLAAKSITGASNFAFQKVTVAVVEF